MGNSWSDTIAARNAGMAPGFHAHDATLEQIAEAEAAARDAGTPEAARATGSGNVMLADDERPPYEVLADVDPPAAAGEPMPPAPVINQAALQLEAERDRNAALTRRIAELEAAARKTAAAKKTAARKTAKAR